MDQKTNVEGGISRNVLKMIAIVTIAIGHFFLYTLTTLNVVQKIPKPWGKLLCYVCFVGPPIFMFFISEGFRYTSSKKKYGMRLLLFAIITQVAFAITTNSGLGFDLNTFFFSWNVFFALLLGFLDLCILTSKENLAIRLSGVLATLILSYVMKTEWRVFGQLIIIAFYYLRERKVLKMVVASILIYLSLIFGDYELGGTLEVYLWTKQTPYIMGFSIIGIVLVSFFYVGKNGAKSKFLKYFFYVFYPIHLILIDIVKLTVGT